ncbi:Derlin-2 [Porphyridium purpureum]|uniref:Derlin n=1 Tax=Porphyridium purpureum TaxID=35688 RepID=A0A5J4YQE1_PORPP|nr:Derlin-2 [Porphyridium purpureum]|eukprot:POR9384..scf236_6
MGSARPAGNMGTVGGYSLWDTWMSIPLVTRNLTAATALVTLGSQLGLFKVMNVLLIWDRVFRFELWRLVLPFFFLGPLGFPLLFLAAIFFRMSRGLEEGEFLGNAADYCYFLILVAAISLPLAYFFRLMYLGPVLVYAMLQLWSRKNQTQTVSIYGIFQVPALYYPYVMLAVSTVLSGGAIDWMGVVGICAGHLYYFLDSVYPKIPSSRGRILIRTPQFLVNLFDQRRPGTFPAPGSASSSEPRTVIRNGQVGPAGGVPPSAGFGTNIGGALRQRFTGGWGSAGGQRLGGGDS